jgi:Spy/CpxP family protein refolding chaperone
MKARPMIFFFLSVMLCAACAGTGLGQTVPNTENEAQAAAPTLSEAQRQAIKRIKVESEKRAAPAALRLAAVVGKIYENMLSDRPDEALRARLSAEMKEAAWALLAIKGQAVRETVNVLTPEQKRLVKSELRKPGAPGDLSEVIARTFKLDDK